MNLFRRETAGSKSVVALFSGIGLGALLMYVFDPERGRRRRAIARDKAVSFAHKTGDALGAGSRDLNNRAKGLVAEVKSALLPNPGREELSELPRPSRKPEFPEQDRGNA